MIQFPRTLEEAAEAAGPSKSLRAGGTDLQELRHKGISGGSLVDLRDVSDAGFRGLSTLEATEEEPAATLVGAGMTVAEIAANLTIAMGYPALAAAAGALATPQIRTRATLGGALMQDVRCWYYRNPAFQCAKRGGVKCEARYGDHLFHSLLDIGGCIAPHPSTLASALLLYDAELLLGNGARVAAELVFDTSIPLSGTTTLEPGTMVHGVVLPEPIKGARGGYKRAISRARAEWPLVEAAVALGPSNATFDGIRIALGGIAKVPLRLHSVEAALEGMAFDLELLRAALTEAEELALPHLPQTLYKANLIAPTVEDALSIARGEA